MKHVGIALIYIAFFALIGFALWLTKSPWVLWALLLTPNYSSRPSKNGAGKEDVS
jgi:hypothetical protein